MQNRPHYISILLFVCLFLYEQAFAQSQAFKWTNIDVDIEVREDGDLLISEQQEYSFESGPDERRHECSRLFVTDRIDDIRDVEVFEVADNGETPSEPAPVRYTTEMDQNDLRICWSCELNAPEIRTFLLKYRVIGAIYVGNYKSARARRVGKQPMDELYWNAVMWPRPAVVEKASVTIHLPPKLRGKNRSVTRAFAY
jgi:hypothetical protein